MNFKILNDRYSANKKEYETFSEKYKLNSKLQLQAMYACHKETGIEGTLAFFVNGYQPHQVYKIEDIKYLLS